MRDCEKCPFHRGLRFITNGGRWDLVAKFTEIESGKPNDPAEVGEGATPFEKKIKWISNPGALSSFSLTSPPSPVSVPTDLVSSGQFDPLPCACRDNARSTGAASVNRLGDRHANYRGGQRELDEKLARAKKPPAVPKFKNSA
jgi:hypothetical protein